MINAEKFKTKTILTERENPKRPGKWNIGIDIGYSGIKIFSPNMISCFPALAKKIPESMITISKEKDTDIQYRNLKTGDSWYVGEAAYSLSNTNDNELALFGRTRYYSDMFKVMSEVGLALGMLSNKYGSFKNEELRVQTGLPPEYRNMDESDLKEVLAGEHHFAIKIGTREWKEFHFELTTDQIDIMDQPMGTLLSISTNNNGKPSSEAKKYFNSKILIFDAGFGTVDIYNVDNGKIVTKPETLDLGMKQVFKGVIKDVAGKYKKEISLTDMQGILSTGKIKVFDKKTKSSTWKSIDDILEINNEKICREALERICSSYEDLVEHDYLVITGGTGAAWSGIIRETLSGMETLTVLSGAQNDNLSPIFANVRGYYMYSLNGK